MKSLYGTSRGYQLADNMAQNRIRPAGPNQAREDFFVYGITFNALAAGATATGNLVFEAESDFEWLASTYFAFIADSGPLTIVDVAVPLITAQLVTTSGRNLFSQALPVFGVWGDGKLPYVLPQSRIFAGRTQLTVQVASQEDAADYNLTLMLHGRKLWDYGPAQG
jgi:hypothetical protein